MYDEIKTFFFQKKTFFFVSISSLLSKLTSSYLSISCCFLFFPHEQDIETFDLEDFKYNSVNITAFRLVDVESPKVVDIMEQMKKFQHSGKDILNGSSVIMVKFCLSFCSHSYFFSSTPQIPPNISIHLIALMGLFLHMCMCVCVC